MKIGIIGAMQIEVDNLKKHMTDTKETQMSGVIFTQGQVEGVEVVAAVCGVGKVFAVFEDRYQCLRLLWKQLICYFPHWQ